MKKLAMITLTLILTLALAVGMVVPSLASNGSSGPIIINKAIPEVEAAETSTSECVYYCLTMQVVGNGTVHPTSGAYPAGDMTITATPASGWRFVGWYTDDMAEIADPSSESTTLTLDKHKVVTATFTREGYYCLTMEVVGNGTVDPPSGAYPAGDMTITATPSSGWRFVGWSTDDMAEIADPSSEATILTLDKDKTVTATFTREGYYYLTMEVVLLPYR